MRVLKSAVLLLGVLPLLAMASNYNVSVTRTGNNTYKIDTANAEIHTRYCYEYPYGERAFLKMYGRTGEIIFLNTGQTCDVKGVYSRVNQTPGKYRVTVSHEDDDWYEVLGQGLYIKTDMCLSLALGEEAILSLNSYGMGRMFIDGNECMVEGIYGEQSL